MLRQWAWAEQKTYVANPYIKDTMCAANPCTALSLSDNDAYTASTTTTHGHGHSTQVRTSNNSKIRPKVMVFTCGAKRQARLREQIFLVFLVLA